MIGKTHGQMTVMRLIKVLAEEKRLPRPDDCPEPVRNSCLFINTTITQTQSVFIYKMNAKKTKGKERKAKQQQYNNSQNV